MTADSHTRCSSTPAASPPLFLFVQYDISPRAFVARPYDAPYAHGVPDKVPGRERAGVWES